MDFEQVNLGENLFGILKAWEAKGINYLDTTNSNNDIVILTIM
jgi:hypothetical protein